MLKSADEYADMAERAQDPNSAHLFAMLALAATNRETAAVQREFLGVQQGAMGLFRETVDMEKARLAPVLVATDEKPEVL